MELQNSNRTLGLIQFECKSYLASVIFFEVEFWCGFFSKIPLSALTLDNNLSRSLDMCVPQFCSLQSVMNFQTFSFFGNEGICFKTQESIFLSPFCCLSSLPATRTRFNGIHSMGEARSLAERLKHWTHNLKVPGSIPGGCEGVIRGFTRAQWNA